MKYQTLQRGLGGAKGREVTLSETIWVKVNETYLPWGLEQQEMTERAFGGGGDAGERSAEVGREKANGESAVI